MHFMLVALISVLGSGLVGIIGVLLHYLLKQNAQRAEEHTMVLAALAKQGTELRDHADGLHREAMAALAKQGTELRDHADGLHREAMEALAKQGDRLDALHDRMVELHLQAMAAASALGERTATLEARVG